MQLVMAMESNISAEELPFWYNWALGPEGSGQFNPHFNIGLLAHKSLNNNKLTQMRFKNIILYLIE